MYIIKLWHVQICFGQCEPHVRTYEQQKTSSGILISVGGQEYTFLTPIFPFPFSSFHLSPFPFVSLSFFSPFSLPLSHCLALPCLPPLISLELLSLHAFSLNIKYQSNVFLNDMLFNFLIIIVIMCVIQSTFVFSVLPFFKSNQIVY